MYPPHSPSTQWPCLSVSEWVCQGLWGYEESESLKPACSRRLQSVVWPRHETWPSNLAHGRYLDVSSPGLLNFTLLSPSPAQVAQWLHTTWQLCHRDSTHTHVTAWERPLLGHWSTARGRIPTTSFYLVLVMLEVENIFLVFTWRQIQV